MTSSFIFRKVHFMYCYRPTIPSKEYDIPLEDKQREDNNNNNSPPLQIQPSRQQRRSPSNTLCHR